MWMISAFERRQRHLVADLLDDLGRVVGVVLFDLLRGV